MASVENLSDSELRKQLMDYGFQPGPVTGLTRKLYVKKLLSLMSQNGKPNKANSSAKVSGSLSRFSSTEEDSDDANTSNRRKSMPAAATKRKSMGRSARAAEAARVLEQERELSDNLLMPSPPAPPPPAPATRVLKPTRGRYSVNESPSSKVTAPTAVRPTRKSVATSSPMRPLRSTSNGFDSGSDSDIPFAPPPRMTRMSAPEPAEEEEDEEDDRPITSLLSTMSDKFLPSSESTRRSPSMDLSGGDYGKHRLSVARDASSVPIDSPDAPYLSAFARRLSQLKAHNLVASHKPSSSLFDDVKESDASSDDSFRSPNPHNGNYFTKKNVIGPTRMPVRRVDPSRTFKTSDESLSFWRNSHAMSVLILCGFGVFVVGLGIVYLNVTAKDIGTVVEEHGTGNVFKICKGGETGDVPGITCVEPEKVAPAMKLFDSAYQALFTRAVQAECGPAQEDGLYIKPSMTEREIVDVVIESNHLSIWDAEEQVANLVVLIKSNPHWGVVVKDDTVRDAQKTSLEVANPNIPLKCLFVNKAYGLCSSLVFIVLGVLGLYGLVQAGYWWVNVREKRRKEVYHYVERIIEILSSHHQSLGPEDHPYLAINHVRDQLIAPQDRQRLKAVWEAAVAFIEQKESRVRGEIQPVNGEGYKVWRWLPPRHNTSIASSTAESPASSPQLGIGASRRKVWQGQAFDTMEGSVNSPPVSPTPCLKLRHMFDPSKESGDHWVQQVQDAILEKCAGAKILHIAVDKSSKEGCVYVKCASETEAGKAFKALHGSWFDSQLVTVKYLRLERYHERFPAAVKCIKPLQPSNNLKLSLQSADDD